MQMLDPRADFCYPFAQLLLRLPPTLAPRVCADMVSRVDVTEVTSCVLTDFTLFYDFSVVVLQAVIALNQLRPCPELFETVTNTVCAVLSAVKSHSQDAIFMIYQNVIMSRLVKELPLINFSLPHFIRIALTCVQGFNSKVFAKVLDAAISNIRNTYPLYSENLLRFEVLLAFTMHATQFPDAREEIARHCIKYTLHSILLPNQEKFVAIDLFVRCIELCPALLKDCEFAYLRLIGYLLNKGKRNLADSEDFIPPLIIKSHDYEFEFTFSDVLRLNYEQLLFLVLSMRKLIDNTAAEGANIDKIYR